MTTNKKTKKLTKADALAALQRAVRKEKAAEASSRGLNNEAALLQEKLEGLRFAVEGMRARELEAREEVLKAQDDLARVLAGGE